MIEKIIQIINVGRFRDLKVHGNVAFQKLTLLFAENGEGKTTLCGILRSFQSGKQEFIEEKKTLGQNGDPFVQMRVDGSTISFAGGTWTRTKPEILIFDSVFIHENVYAGDYVDHYHKKTFIASLLVLKVCN